tara:strand:- start:168 stop:425 length:258 start_codon:yes stop_codon:yes gene_type:complete
MAKKSNKLEGYTDTVSILETMKEGRYMPKWVEQNNIIPNTKGEEQHADGNRNIRVNERETTKKEQKENKVSSKPKTSKKKKENKE